MVNAIIKKRDAYNAFNRQRGMMSITEAMNSDMGNAQGIIEETGLNIGDSAICSLKTLYSINLLMPVYKKSIIKSMAMISIMVALDSQEKEIILVNVLRF
jgi:hypothetical protein